MKRQKVSLMNMSLRERIQIVDGDIVKLKVDAIVNAANSSLLGGGGVDGAIHRAAGPDLLEECRALGGCPTGEARLTKGYRLHAKYVIHTVGPVWQGGDRSEDELLASCYRSCLILADRHGIQTVAFPSISTGTYGYPIDRAARIAIGEIKNHLEGETGIQKVTLVCFGRAAFAVHLTSMEDYFPLSWEI